MNLADLLFDDSVDPGRLAVHAGGRSLTIGELRVLADRLADRLRAAGVRPGAPVGAMIPNSGEAIGALFGVLRAEAVYVPLNPRAALREVRTTAEKVPLALIVARPDRASDLGAWPLIEFDGDLGWTEADRGAAPVSGYDASVAIACFTSGTTSEPKPVFLRHEAFLDQIDRVLLSLRRAPGRHRDGRPPMPNLIVASMALFAGIYNTVFAFRVGAPVVLMDKFAPREFADLVRRFGIRSVVLPPAAMVMLMDDPAVTDLGPLAIVRSGTAPLPGAQARRFRDRFGLTVLNCYGQSELGGEIVGWNIDDARTFFDEKAGAVGRPNPGVELRVVGADGRELPVGESGELLVRTPAVAAGALREVADRIVGDGWFRTGDLGLVDADGFLWITGRVSDMINRGGLKVSPSEVEDVLREHPAVADVAVAGLPDTRLGEVPVAFLVFRAGERPAAAELTAWCRARLLPYKVPTEFRAVGTLPRNEIGKVLRRDLVAGAPGSRAADSAEEETTV